MSSRPKGKGPACRGAMWSGAPRRLSLRHPGRPGKRDSSSGKRISAKRFWPVYAALCAVSLLFVSTNDVAASNAAFLSAKQVVPAPKGASDVCRRYAWVCARAGKVTPLSQRQIEVAQSLNREINRSVRDIADMSQYNRMEVWALPTGRGGDCEDFALLKKLQLTKAGIAPQRLLIATVLDRNRNSHAVLILRTDQGDYVLDNLNDRVLHWSKTGYTFLRMQNPRAPNSWVAVFSGGILSGQS